MNSNLFLKLTTAFPRKGIIVYIFLLWNFDAYFYENSVKLALNNFDCLMEAMDKGHKEAGRVRADEDVADSGAS